MPTPTQPITTASFKMDTIMEIEGLGKYEGQGFDDGTAEGGFFRKLGDAPNGGKTAGLYISDDMDCRAYDRFAQGFHQMLSRKTKGYLNKLPDDIELFYTAIMAGQLSCAQREEEEGQKVENVLIKRTVDYDLNEYNNDSCQLEVSTLKNGNTQITMQLSPEGDGMSDPNYWEGHGNKWIITVSRAGRIVDLQIDTTTGYAKIPTNYGEAPRGIFSVAQIYEEGNVGPRGRSENTFTGLMLSNGVKKTPEEIYDRLRQILDELVKREGFEGWYGPDTPKLTIGETTILVRILSKMPPASSTPSAAPSTEPPAAPVAPHAPDTTAPATEPPPAAASEQPAPPPPPAGKEQTVSIDLGDEGMPAAPVGE